MRTKLPAVPRHSNRPPMTKNKNPGNSTTSKPHASRGANVFKGGMLPKEPAAYIEKTAGKEAACKKKKEQNKTENDIAKRLAPHARMYRRPPLWPAGDPHQQHHTHSTADWAGGSASKSFF